MVLLITMTVTAWFTTSIEIRKMEQALEREMVAMSNTVALASSYMVVTNKLDEIETLLIQSVKLPSLESLGIWDAKGMPMSFVSVNDKGEEEVRFDAGLIDPSQLDDTAPTVSYSQFHTTMEIWYPIRSADTVGWLKAKIDMRNLRALQNDAVLWNVAGVLATVLINALALLLLLRVPVRKLSLAVDFAGELTSASGKQIDGHGSSKETQALIDALNRSSNTLHQKTVALLDSNQELERANKAKSEFLAAMSHEIRTPMTAIMGFSDILLKDPLSADAKHKIGKIKDATRSLLSIINDILDISKLDAGKMEPERLDFHLPSLIQQVTGLFEEKRSGRRAKDLTLETVFSENCPHAIRSDPTRLRQILVNLVGNAMKFTQEGCVTVESGAIVGDDGKDYLRIAVRDTGIGIQQGVLDSLFLEFSQGDASISRRFEGTGLGLAICKRLVELMGGQIGVDSEYGKGSTFWFTLPLIPAESDVLSYEKKNNDAPANFRARRKLNLLLAEDTELNQEIFRTILEGLGHRVAIANDGREAVSMHETGAYDLILMDIRMPVMSGVDATRLIRGMPGDKSAVPIIALTADVMEESKVVYADAGMNGVVAKPVEVSDLLHAMDDACGETNHEVVTVSPEPPEAAPTGIPASQPPDGGKNLPMEIPGMDLPAALEMVRGNEKLLRGLLIKFREGYSTYAEDIENALAEGKNEEAKRMAHSLKGVSGTLKAERVYLSACTLDAALRDSADPSEISPLVSDLSQALAEIQASLHSAL